MSPPIVKGALPLLESLSIKGAISKPYQTQTTMPAHAQKVLMPFMGLSQKLTQSP
jgi:hypothetical protein